MGLSIYYKGYLKKTSLLPELIREVKDVAEIHGWKYQVFDTVFPDEQFQKEVDFDNLYGIRFPRRTVKRFPLCFCQMAEWCVR